MNTGSSTTIRAAENKSNCRTNPFPRGKSSQNPHGRPMCVEIDNNTRTNPRSTSSGNASKQSQLAKAGRPRSRERNASPSFWNPVQADALPCTQFSGSFPTEDQPQNNWYNSRASESSPMSGSGPLVFVVLESESEYHSASYQSQHHSLTFPVISYRPNEEIIFEGSVDSPPLLFSLAFISCRPSKYPTGVLASSKGSPLLE